MFYKDEDIRSELTCPLCFELYDDPRFLSCCGETVCNTCIDYKLTLDESQQIDCSLCKQKYERPRKGFLINKKIAKLLSKKPDEICQSEQVKELKNALCSLEERVFAFGNDLANGQDQIKDYCLQLRSQVDLESDQRIEMIHREREKLLEEIGKYELKCIQSCEAKESAMLDMNQLLNTIRRFCDEKKKYLSNFRVEEAGIESSLQEAEKYLQNLNFEEETLTCLRFDGEKLKFTPSKTVSVSLGQLTGHINPDLYQDYRDLCDSSYEYDFSNSPGQFETFKKRKLTSTSFFKSKSIRDEINLIETKVKSDYY